MTTSIGAPWERPTTPRARYELDVAPGGARFIGLQSGTSAAAEGRRLDEYGPTSSHMSEAALFYAYRNTGPAPVEEER